MAVREIVPLAEMEKPLHLIVFRVLATESPDLK
jgi:hypothetical protein